MSSTATAEKLEHAPIIPGSEQYKEFQDEVWKKAKEHMKAAVEGAKTSEGPSFYVPSETITDFMNHRIRGEAPTERLVKKGDVASLSELGKIVRAYDEDCESIFTPGAYGKVHKDLENSATFAAFAIGKAGATLGIFSDDLEKEDLLLTLVENIVILRARGMMLWKDKDSEKFTCNHLFSRGSKHVGCPNSLYSQLLERCPCFWIHPQMLYQQIAIDPHGAEKYSTWAHYQDALAHHHKLLLELQRTNTKPTQEQEELLRGYRKFGFQPSDGQGQNPSPWTLIPTPLCAQGIDLLTAYKTCQSGWVVTNNNLDGEFKQCHEHMLYYTSTLSALNGILNAFGEDRTVMTRARNLLTKVYLSNYKLHVQDTTVLPSEYNAWADELLCMAVGADHYNSIETFIATKMSAKTAPYRITRIETFQLLISLPYDFNAWKHATSLYSAYSGFHTFQGAAVSAVEPDVRLTNILVSDYSLSVYLAIQEFKEAREQARRQEATDTDADTVASSATDAASSASATSV